VSGADQAQDDNVSNDDNTEDDSILNSDRDFPRDYDCDFIMAL